MTRTRHKRRSQFRAETTSRRTVSVRTVGMDLPMAAHPLSAQGDGTGAAGSRRAHLNRRATAAAGRSPAAPAALHVTALITRAMTANCMPVGTSHRQPVPKPHDPVVRITLRHSPIVPNSLQFRLNRDELPRRVPGFERRGGARLQQNAGAAARAVNRIRTRGLITVSWLGSRRARPGMSRRKNEIHRLIDPRQSHSEA